MGILKTIVTMLRALFASRAELAAENLALRHQLSVLTRSVKRPIVRQRDRIFWAWLSRIWSAWRSALLIVKPETVIRWHRQGLRLYWRCLSRRRKTGRPSVDREIRELIRQMSGENRSWGAPRIQSELALLGYEVAESTVAKYIGVQDFLRTLFCCRNIHRRDELRRCRGAAR